MLLRSDLGQYAQEFLLTCKSENKSRRTLDVYGRAIKFFITFMAENNLPLSIENVTALHIRAYINSWDGHGLTPESVSAYYRPVRTLFEYLVREKYLKESPFVRVKAPRVPKKLVKPFPQSVMLDLLTLCALPDYISVRNRAMLLLFYDTGIRLEEMSKLRLDEINWSTQLVLIHGKGSKERIVHFETTTLLALRKYIRMREMKWHDSYPELWVTEEGTPLHYAGVQLSIKRLCHRVDVPKGVKRGPHTLRHTSGTDYLRAGGSIKSLQEMFGHANITTTMKYVDALGSEVMIAEHRKYSPVDNLLKNSKG